MNTLRDMYRQTLIALMHDDPRIYCLEADLGGHRNPVQAAFPERYLNLGIAEFSLINIASGMAAEGLVPFASTFAPFAVLRACEAVKLSLGYMQWNVKLVCPYGGVSGAWFGPTHQCLEDYAILASFPGIAFAAPHGAHEAAAVVQWAHRHTGPVYLRLGRNGSFADVEYEDDVSYPSPRRARDWRTSADATLVSVGEIGTELCGALQAPLQQLGLRCRHLHLLFPDAAGLAAAADVLRDAKHIVVIEEHRVATGVGTMLQSLLADRPLLRIGADDAWISTAGSHDDLLAAYGLSVAAIVPRIVHHHRRVS